MRCYVYVDGRIVRYSDGSRKHCELWMLGAVNGLEAVGTRLRLTEGRWHGYTTFGKPVLVFVGQTH